MRPRPAVYPGRRQLCIASRRVSIVGTRRARRFLEEQGWRGGRRRAAARAGTTPPSVPRFHRVPRGGWWREIVAPLGGWRRRVPRGGRLARARRVPRHATEPDRGFDVEQLVRRGRGLRWRPRSVAARPIPWGGWDDSRGGEDGGRVRRVAEGVGWRVRREVARRAPLLHPPGLVRRGRHAVDTRRPPPCDRGRGRVLRQCRRKRKRLSVAPISSARRQRQRQTMISLWAKWVERPRQTIR